MQLTSDSPKYSANNSRQRDPQFWARWRLSGMRSMMLGGQAGWVGFKALPR
jgi:hypothetical protein